LGWFGDGIIYDLQGDRVGFIRSKCPVITSVETVKSVKLAKPVKSLRSVPYLKSTFGTSLSNVKLKEFFE
jgi:hypothetical protein